LAGQKRILLTMATGVGNTFVAFQAAWQLWKAGRKKRILFLADRNVLIDQAKDWTFAPRMGREIAPEESQLPGHVHPGCAPDCLFSMDR
jgi:type I site-specific restriction endonuclease